MSNIYETTARALERAAAEIRAAGASTPAPAPPPGPPPPATGGHTIPGGRSKGTPLVDATDDDLYYWAGRLAQGGGDPRFAAKDRELLAAVRAEIARRGGRA